MAVGVQSRELSWWAAGVQRRVSAVGTRRPQPALGKRKNMDTQSRGQLDPDNQQMLFLKHYHLAGLFPTEEYHFLLFTFTDIDIYSYVILT